jgi:hypothetical protein
MVNEDLPAVNVAYEAIEVTSAWPPGQNRPLDVEPFRVHILSQPVLLLGLVFMARVVKCSAVGPARTAVSVSTPKVVA